MDAAMTAILVAQFSWENSAINLKNKRVLLKSNKEHSFSHEAVYSYDLTSELPAAKPCCEQLDKTSSYVVGTYSLYQAAQSKQHVTPETEMTSKLVLTSGAFPHSSDLSRNIGVSRSGKGQGSSREIRSPCFDV